MYVNKVKVKEEMSKKGFKTFTELAEAVGITKNQMSVIMSESYDPFKSSINNLCSVLDVSPSEIIYSHEKFKSDYVPLSNSVTAIELFAGAGGLALGLEKAGIETLAFVECDRACCETLHKNRPSWNIISQDIHNVSFTQYKNKVDIVTGGFPCQSFSYAGKRMGLEDTRGTLFHEFARCIKEVEPIMFLAENVKGLKSHDNGRTLNTILNVFEELGYKVKFEVLNAAYFGVAQKRERIVIVGVKNDVDVEYKFPNPNTKVTPLKEALIDCPVSKGSSYSEYKKKVFSLVPPGGCWVDLPEDVAKEYMGKSYYSSGGRRGMARRISWDEPCLTLTCSPSQKQTDRCHPEEDRPFTIREYARIQSFPDDWYFCGAITDQYKQIGNAVPVELARRIAVELKNSVLRSRKKIAC